MCKRDNLLKNGLKDGYFRSLSYRLCLLMTMHYEWYWIKCTAQLYYSHASASVIATRWILTNSPRCDGINLCCWVVRSEPGELINIHLIALSSKRLHLKAVFRYQTQVEAYLLNWVILSPETWLSIIWQKKLSAVFVEIKLCMTVVVLSYFIGWNLTFFKFLGLLERYVIICFWFFM